MEASALTARRTVLGRAASDPALASALWTGGIDGTFVSLSSSSWLGFGE